MELYWHLRLPHFEALLMFFGVISLIMGTILFIAGIIFYCNDVYDDTQLNMIYKKGKYLILFSMLFFFMSCFFPTNKDLAIMLGWDAVKSETVQEVIEILKEKIK